MRNCDAHRMYILTRPAYRTLPRWYAGILFPRGDRLVPYTWDFMMQTTIPQQTAWVLFDVAKCPN